MAAFFYGYQQIMLETNAEVLKRIMYGDPSVREFLGVIFTKPRRMNFQSGTSMSRVPSLQKILEDVRILKDRFRNRTDRYLVLESTFERLKRRVPVVNDSVPDLFAIPIETFKTKREMSDRAFDLASSGVRFQVLHEKRLHANKQHG